MQSQNHDLDNKLQVARQHNDLKAMQVFIAQGAAIDSTLLIWAADFEIDASADSDLSLNLIHQILQNKNVDINAVDDQGETALMKAVLNNNSTLVTLLISHKANLDICNHEGDTALNLSAQVSPAKIIELLIQAKADLNIQNNIKETALISAVKEYNSDNDNRVIIACLLDAKADLRIFDQNRLTAFQHAIRTNSVPIIQKMIETESINTVAINFIESLLLNQDNNTFTNFIIQKYPATLSHPVGTLKAGELALKFAVLSNKQDKIKLLLELKIDPNFTGSTEPTALQEATLIGNIEIVKTLLDAKTDPTFASGNIPTPFQLAISNHIHLIPLLSENAIPLLLAQAIMKAAENRKLDIINFLIKKHPNVLDYKFPNGITIASVVLAVAIEYNEINLVKELIDKRVDLNMLDFQGKIPIIKAATLRRSEIVELILNEAKISDRSKELLLITAASMNQEAIVRTLISEHKVNINALDHKGNTALISAAQHSHENMINILLESKSEVEIKNNEQKTAFMQALHSPVIMEKLIEAKAEMQIQLRSVHLQQWVSTKPRGRLIPLASECNDELLTAIGLHFLKRVVPTFLLGLKNINTSLLKGLGMEYLNYANQSGNDLTLLFYNIANALFDLSTVKTDHPTLENVISVEDVDDKSDHHLEIDNHNMLLDQAKFLHVKSYANICMLVFEDIFMLHAATEDKSSFQPYLIIVDAINDLAYQKTHIVPLDSIKPSDVATPESSSKIAVSVAKELTNFRKPPPFLDQKQSFSEEANTLSAYINPLIFKNQVSFAFIESIKNTPFNQIPSVKLQFLKKLVIAENKTNTDSKFDSCIQRIQKQLQNKPTPTFNFSKDKSAQYDEMDSSNKKKRKLNTTNEAHTFKKPHGSN